MGLFIQLHLLGLMLITKIYSFDKEAHPVLQKCLEALGIYDDKPLGREEVKKCFYIVLSSLGKKFSYYDANEMLVNTALNGYLENLYYDMRNGMFERPKTIAMTICGAGNRGGERDQASSLAKFISEVHFVFEKLEDFHDDKDDFGIEILQAYVRKLEYIEKIFELVDVFVTGKAGAEAGLPEYPESALEDLDEIPDPDFDMDGLVCASSLDCLCGCQMDHPLKVIEGMEDFLNGVESPNREYFIGVAGANNIRLEGYAGNEGPIFDAIKDLGEKAWNALTASLKAIKEMFSTSDSSAKVEAAGEAADNNKKALQAMKDTSAVINDKAREGITNLAASIDPSGKLKNLVSQLRTPKDAPKVIDALLGFMSKEATNNGAVGKQLDTAATSIADLKSATGAASGDESNKDVVAAKKAKIQDKVKGSKEAIKEVKFELAAHNKLMQGIQKAIAGISPKIFIADKSKDEGNKDE